MNCDGYGRKGLKRNLKKAFCHTVALKNQGNHEHLRI